MPGKCFHCREPTSFTCETCESVLICGKKCIAAHECTIFVLLFLDTDKEKYKSVSTFYKLVNNNPRIKKLINEGNKTIFVPTNDAISNYIQELQPKPSTSDIEKLLMNHIVEGIFTREDLEKNQTGYLTTVSGNKLPEWKADNGIYVGDNLYGAAFISYSTQIEMDNKVNEVHIINKVARTK